MSKEILCLFDFEEKHLEELKKIAKDYKFVFSVDKATPENLEIIVGWTDEATRLIKNEDSNVKWIQFPYAGINTLPLELFEEKDISLSNGSGIHSAAVSESVMGFILGFTRNIVVGAKNQIEENG